MEGKTPPEAVLAAGNGGLTASYIQQLASAIRLLQSRPGLPLDAFGSVHIRHFAASAAEVDAIAAALVIEAGWNADRSHYTAEYRFGQNVSYGVVYIVPAHQEAYRAHMATFKPELAVA
jgi:hypothetical protein